MKKAFCLSLFSFLSSYASLPFELDENTCHEQNASKENVPSLTSNEEILKKFRETAYRPYYSHERGNHIRSKQNYSFFDQYGHEIGAE